MANEPTPPKPSPKWRWLISNQERALGFPLPAKFHAANKSTTPDAKPLTLRPGANLIAVRDYEAHKAADPDREEDGVKVLGEINRLLTTDIPFATHKNRQSESAGKRHLVEGPLVANDRAPLDGLTDAESLTIVRELRNELILKALLEIEKRPAVNEALHRQLKTVTTGHLTQAVA